jgi:hypothetical protein
MAGDPVLEYWAEIMKRTPISPELMGQWKRVMDHGIEAWSRALSEVMATDEFAQLLGTSIEQWLAAQASITGNRAQPAVQATQATQLAAVATQLTVIAAQLSRLEERMSHVEERITSSVASAAGAAVTRESATTGETAIRESAAGEAAIRESGAAQAVRRSTAKSASARMPRRSRGRRAA